MSALRVATSLAKARLVANDEYFAVAQSLIERARDTCLVSLFIIDLKSGYDDTDLRVFQLLKGLQEAHWRGVGVRLLVGGSRTNVLIAEAAEIARFVTLGLGVPVRWLTSQDVRGSHAKLVISDSWVLTGSHNWSAQAFESDTGQRPG